MLVKHIIRTISKQNPATGRYNFPGIKNTNNNTPILRRNFNTEIEKEKRYIKDVTKGQMAYLRNISLKNISVIHDNDDIEVECIPLNGAVKVKGSDTEQLKNATTLLKKELFYNMYEKKFKISTIENQVRYALLKHNSNNNDDDDNKNDDNNNNNNEEEEDVNDNDKNNKSSSLQKGEFGAFLRNELDKDVEKVFEQYETIAVFDSVDEIKHNTLTGKILMEVTLVGKNKEQIQKITPEFLKLLLGEKAYEEDYSKQGFQGDISHLFEHQEDEYADIGALTESGEMKVQNMSTLRMITFNRPKVLNALSLNMVRELTDIIQGYHINHMTKALVFKGAGGKAFCAGGDIKNLHDDGLNPDTRHKTHEFFSEEYQLNQWLRYCDLPIVSILNGITMGGGVGLSVHGEFRIAMDKTVFAMPETGIGFFPDVGGSYFLPRLEHPGIGFYLGLTGKRLKGYDVLHAGIATHYLPIEEEKLESYITMIQQCLDDSDQSRDTLSNCIEIQHLLDTLQTSIMKDVEDPKVLETEFSSNIDQISDIFYQDENDTVMDVYNRLTIAAENDVPLANEALKAMKRCSPTAIHVTHKMLMEGLKKKDMTECMEMEYNVAQQFMEAEEASSDFFPGVHSIIYGKGKTKPTWTPTTLAEVKEEDVMKYFDTTGKKQLPLFHPPGRTKGALSSIKRIYDARERQWREYSLDNNAEEFRNVVFN